MDRAPTYASRVDYDDFASACAHTPLEALAAFYGSEPAISRVLGMSEKAANRWKYPSMRRGAGDVPHAEHMRALIVDARRRGGSLTLEDLVFGCDAARLDELRAEGQRLRDEKAAT